MTKHPDDHPFLEVCHAADTLIQHGATVHQKFSCAGCGNRLTIETPNVFHRTGTCDKCSTVTDIQARGCNYLVILPVSRRAKTNAGV
jgi:hypothetical protein